AQPKRVGRGARRYVTHSGHLLRLLCLHSERPSNDAPAHHCDKRSPVHHWMISSARTRMDCGIVRPRAFAVLRLITSSYVISCLTCSRAVLPPFRILSTYAAARRNLSARSAP